MRIIMLIYCFFHLLTLCLVLGAKTDQTIIPPQRVANFPSARVQKPYVANTLVGYYIGCDGQDIQKHLYKTKFGQALVISKTIGQLHELPNQVNCNHAKQKLCQLATDLRIWKYLAKLNLDVGIKEDKLQWRSHFPYAYDAAPIIFNGYQRYIPAHLLAKTTDFIGATYEIEDDGLSMLIGDDGGIRRGNSALFSSYCKPFANLAFHNPTWDDPDSKEFKKASELAQRRVFALGDLRGDMDNALAILREAKIIDNEGDWSGGSNTVLGNVIGNGPNSDDLLRFFARLVKQANEKGGRVIQLLGDQEIMRLINRKNYIDDPSEPRHIVSFSDNTSIEIGEIEKRLYSLPIVQRVGDTVFTHGGLTPFFALKDIKATNDEAKYAISSIMIRNQQDEIIASIFGGDGPVMYQLYANYTKEKQLCSQLKQALKILNAKRMVSGYSIQNNAKIASRCSSQFFGISVGDSKAYRKNKGLLEISPNAMVNAIYTETRETLDAGSINKEVVVNKY